MMDRAAFAKAFPVSRETLERLDAFCALLEKWNARINLVAKPSLEDIWRRHILDSAQLWQHRPASARHWADFGSGGGLPGLVIAILAAEEKQIEVTLIEADTRKAAFLSTVSHTLELPVRVEAVRIEALPPKTFDVLSARALAPLPRLLALLAPFAHENSRLILPKGRDHAKELTEARARWTIDSELHHSLSDPEGRVLILHLSRIQA